VAEGADVPLSHTVRDASSHFSPDVCVGVVLGDALRRVSTLGGREGMSRSLRSVYSASVTLFLGGSLRGVVSRVIDTPGVPGVKSYCNGVAVSLDGTTLLVSDGGYGCTHAIREVSVADGSLSASAAMGRCSSTARARCASHPTASCSSLTAATTACRC
jgi:hypothetical protein